MAKILAILPDDSSNLGKEFKERQLRLLQEKLKTTIVKMKKVENSNTEQATAISDQISKLLGEPTVPEYIAP